MWSKFSTVKELLISAPILKIAEPKKDFVVWVDAYIEGIGGILMQEGYMKLYESRRLEEHEKNYGTHDLEVVSILHALKM